MGAMPTLAMNIAASLRKFEASVGMRAGRSVRAHAHASDGDFL
jgi:hypothetical protein